MKASYRKYKLGYYPVIIFNDKSRMTHRIHCNTENIALILAKQIVAKLSENNHNHEI